MIELKPAINEVKLTLKSISSPINLGTVLEPSGGGGSCVPTEVRQAIYTLLDNAAYATTGLEDEIAIVQAWAQEVTALSISPTSLEISNTPQVITATVVPSGSLVTWTSSDESVATVVGGVVTGASNGSCVITATAGGLSANCAVTVSGFVTLESISAVYTQSGTVYDTDSLDSLKTDLVVTATYDDTSTATVPSTDYTLSGTLEVGTSTITVTYSGKTTTFTVTVTSSFQYGVYTPESAISGYYIDNTGVVQSATNNSGYIEDYIPVISASYWISYRNAYIYVVNSKLVSEVNWRLSEYDENKNFIKQTQFSKTGTTSNTQYASRIVTFDQNTKYIRLGWYNSHSTDTGVFDIEDPSTMTELPMEVGDINSSTGQNATSSGNVRIRMTNYISASNTLTVNGCPFADTFGDWNTNGGYAFRCYNSSHGFVGSLTNSGNLFKTNISSVQLPSGTAYIRMFAQYASGIDISEFNYAVNRLIEIDGNKYYVVG